MRPQPIRSTTILAIRHRGEVVVAGDGQVSLGATVIKHQAKKVRRLYHDQVITGFAGSTADAFTLFSRFENKLEEYRGNLRRAAVELSKEWRTDKYLQKLEALLIVADREALLLLSGAGDVLEPEENVIAIGSGGPYALAAARALLRNTSMEVEEVVRRSLKIASEICIYTNDTLTVEVLDHGDQKE